MILPALSWKVTSFSHRGIYYQTDRLGGVSAFLFFIPSVASCFASRITLTADGSRRSQVGGGSSQQALHNLPTHDPMGSTPRLRTKQENKT